MIGTNKMKTIEAIERSNTVAPRFNLRTANGQIAQQLWAAGRAANQDNAWLHGRITTANSEWFLDTHYSEPMTNYAVGWQDPEDLGARLEFLAPNFPAPGELFQHLQFDNSEEFLTDGTIDDIRAINADFKTVDYTQSLVSRRMNNRGLRIELDWDRIKNDPIWQQRYTEKLLRRIKRNQYVRAVALGVASGVGATLHWTGANTEQPDIDLSNQRLLSQTASGIKPNRILCGDTAWQYRLAAYAAATNAQNQFAAAAALQRTPDDIGAWLGVGANGFMIDRARSQSGTAKSEILGAMILMFTGLPGVDAEDPTNFKLAWTTCQNGQRYAVYVRQINVKKWEIVVEHYELLFAATVLGVRALTTANA
jgi:hypothetical protein